MCPDWWSRISDSVSLNESHHPGYSYFQASDPDKWNPLSADTPELLSPQLRKIEHRPQVYTAQGVFGALECLVLPPFNQDSNEPRKNSPPLQYSIHRYRWSSDWNEWYKVTMKGWLLVAKISCSAKARFILFRFIISFLLTTEIRQQPANGLVYYAVWNTFHREQFARLFLSHKVYLPHVSFSNYLDLIEASRANLDILYFDRIGTVCSWETLRLPKFARIRWSYSCRYKLSRIIFR